jgi:hypothetical protein
LTTRVTVSCVSCFIDYVFVEKEGVERFETLRLWCSVIPYLLRWRSYAQPQLKHADTTSVTTFHLLVSTRIFMFSSSFTSRHLSTRFTTGRLVPILRFASHTRLRCPARLVSSQPTGRVVDATDCVSYRSRHADVLVIVIGRLCFEETFVCDADVSSDANKSRTEAINPPAPEPVSPGTDELTVHG